MTHTPNARTNIFVFLAVLTASALIMIWMLWHHPLQTLLVTFAVLAFFAVSARLARSIDTDGSSELHQGRRQI